MSDGYDKQKLDGLLSRVADESATLEELAALEQVLISSPAARRYYVHYLDLHEELRIRAAEGNLEPPRNPAKSPVLGFLGGVVDYVNHSRMLMFSLIALMLSGWFIFQLGSLMIGRARLGGAPMASQPTDPNSQDVSHPPGGLFASPASPRESDSVASTSVAWMTATVDCHWRVVPPAAPPASAPAPAVNDTAADTVLYNGEPFHVGSELQAGRQLDLVHGLAEITFRSGARIVLNGPAHFTVGSPLGGRLQIGKLTARVPHDAHGFTVNTPAGKVVDLGTEFGVAVAADHTMNVEVFVGEVAVDASSAGSQTPSSPSTTPTLPQKLTAGHAVHVEAGKPVANIPLDPKRFVRGLGPREDPHVAQAAYLDYVKSLKPVVWFRMEGQSAERVLHDEMGGPDAKLNWDGPGNPFVEGRLGKSLWLRGSALKDCAVVPDYPKAEHDKLTVSAWAYSNFRSPDAAIVANWSDGLGRFYLGLGDQGVDLTVFVIDRNGQRVFAHEGLSHPFPLYEWQHVAFVTNGSVLRLYRQGNEVGSIQIAGLASKVTARALVIGNRSAGSGAAADSALSSFWWDGRLDEITVFNDVLTADDIRKLAAAPPQ